jgi:predicted transcriptional regulator
MATMTHRTTFALDSVTENAIQRLAKRWDISKAEVVRRSVAQAEAIAETEGKPSPLEALEWLQSHGTLTEAKVKTWATGSRKGWDEAWQRREPTPITKAKAKTQS